VESTGIGTTIEMERKRALRWTGALAGAPALAGAYRALMSRRAASPKRYIHVRATVDPDVVSDLVDLVRRVRGQAALEARDSFSVPVPRGIPEQDAYRELRALIHNWELRHPGVRAEILPGSGPDLDQTNGGRLWRRHMRSSQ
jgi:hypothetical protein